MDVDVNSSFVVMKGAVSEGENEGDGGSSTRDNAMGHCTLLSGVVRGRSNSGLG